MGGTNIVLANLTNIKYDDYKLRRKKLCTRNQDKLSMIYLVPKPKFEINDYKLWRSGLGELANCKPIDGNTLTFIGL
jgi:hypothetical protein